MDKDTLFKNLFNAACDVIEWEAFVFGGSDAQCWADLRAAVAALTRGTSDA